MILNVFLIGKVLYLVGFFVIIFRFLNNFYR